MNYSQIFTPNVSAFTVSGGGTHTLTFTGQVQTVQMSNLSSGNISVLLNSLAGATMTLHGNTAQSFNRTDVTLTSLQFNNTASGASAVSIEVFYSIVT